MNFDLVIVKRNMVLTSSEFVAEKFGKRHNNVLKKIDKLRAEIANSSAPNGADENDISIEIFVDRFREYNGRKIRYIDMNRPAFALLVMGFTGKEALNWKRKFNNQFFGMEKALLRQQSAEWQRAREIGKTTRLALTDKVKEFVEYAKTQGSKNAETYYITFTKMQYKALGFIEKHGKTDKDFLNDYELTLLTTIENATIKALDLGMEEGKQYKDIYQIAKQNIFQISSMLNL